MGGLAAQGQIASGIGLPLDLRVESMSLMINRRAATDFGDNSFPGEILGAFGGEDLAGQLISGHRMSLCRLASGITAMSMPISAQTHREMPRFDRKVR